MIPDPLEIWRSALPFEPSREKGKKAQGSLGGGVAIAAMRWAQILMTLSLVSLFRNPAFTPLQSRGAMLPPSRPLTPFILCYPPALMLHASLSLSLCGPAAAAFQPIWTSQGETQGTGASGRGNERADGSVAMGQEGAGSVSEGGKEEARGKASVGGEECNGATCAGVALPPPYSQQLFVAAGGSNQAHAHAGSVDPKATSLHLPPAASYKHGVALGMTIIARGSDGRPVHAPGLTFTINVTQAGDSHTGSVFDLQNGTYYVYSTIFYSPRLDAHPEALVSVRLDGHHIAGSPAPVPLLFQAFQKQYGQRLRDAVDAGKHDAFASRQGCGGDFVLVSGSSSAMFDRLVNLIGSFHEFAPSTPIIVYDLGLSSPQVDDVKTWEGVEYRQFPYEQYPPHVKGLGEKGAYAWRGPILTNVSMEHECLLWLDAGLELRGDFGVVKGFIAREGHFYVTNGWPSPNRFTHPDTVAAFGLTAQDFYSDGGTRIEIEACGGIQGYRRGSVMQSVVLPAYTSCLLDPICSTPAGSSKSNFRQDQTILNVVLAKYRKGLEAGSHEFELSLPHTDRRYWEHPVPKHQFPARNDGTFRACERGKAFRDGECVPCVDSSDAVYNDPLAIVCEDDEELYSELEGAEYVSDLVIFIRRAFHPRMFEESLRYRLMGSI